MDCIHHTGLPAAAACARCGASLCEPCAISWKGTIVCKECLQKSQKENSVGKRAHLRKSPTLAGLLSLFPGAGQIYIGYYAVGFFHAAVVAALITMLAGNDENAWEPFLGFFLSFFWIFTVIDAVRRARLYNESMAGESIPKMPTDSPLVGGILLLLLGLVLTLEITLGISLKFLQSIWPLAILVAGVLLLVRYMRTRKVLSQQDQKRLDPTVPQPSTSVEKG